MLVGGRGRGGEEEEGLAEGERRGRGRGGKEEEGLGRGGRGGGRERQGGGGTGACGGSLVWPVWPGFSRGTNT